MTGIALYQKMFASYFSNEKLTLPAVAGIKNRPVTIHSGGWTVKCTAYDLNEEIVLEFYASHPDRADRHARFHPDGRVEDLLVILQGDPGAVPADQLESYWDEIRIRNQELMHELSQLGLL